MSLFDELVVIYPELTNADFDPESGSITLKDDGDGIGYIAKWDYDQPIPDGLTLGKPSA
jgi:hypothetical protein